MKLFANGKTPLACGQIVFQDQTKRKKKINKIMRIKREDHYATNYQFQEE
jgi:hypothetical protein